VVSIDSVSCDIALSGITNYNGEFLVCWHLMLKNTWDLKRDKMGGS
jgi:hypothetical protein